MLARGTAQLGSAAGSPPAPLCCTEFISTKIFPRSYLQRQTQRCCRSLVLHHQPSLDILNTDLKTCGCGRAWGGRSWGTPLPHSAYPWTGFPYSSPLSQLLSTQPRLHAAPPQCLLIYFNIFCCYYYPLNPQLFIVPPSFFSVPGQ